MMNFFPVKKEQGFALLFAVLIASVVLAISLGISLITVREVRLSGIVRDGVYAVYASNSGYECALYYDGLAGTSSVFVAASGVSGTPITIYCGQSGGVTTIGGNDGLYDYAEFSYDTQSNICAKVRVLQAYPVDMTGTLGVQIVAHGYNMSCADVASNDPRLVERSLEVLYAY